LRRSFLFRLFLKLMRPSCGSGSCLTFHSPVWKGLGLQEPRLQKIPLNPPLEMGDLKKQLR
jgi:hypothetical protein